MNPNTEELTSDELEISEPLAARAPVDSDSPTFAALGARPETVAALEAVGITRAFAIQQMVLPIALTGDDIIGQARTGTGKTLGFGIPLLDRVTAPDEGADGSVQALVVVPTRELAVQVTRDLLAAGAQRHIRVVSVYGGRAYDPQIKSLRKGVDVVVGTPGRLLDLADQGHLELGKVGILVLDEADEMLDLGFLPDIEKILRLVPDERQTMLFSATMPGPIVQLARQFMNKPTHVRAEDPGESNLLPTTAHFVYRAHALDKTEMLSRVLQAESRGLTMVFCRTKRTAQKVADDLSERGFAAAAVHGDLGQGAREQALRAFRNGKVDVLVATDVAARGIDVVGVTHVINYQCPEDEKVYVHRIGRTGRAGRSGTAVTFVDWDEIPRWKSINDALDLSFPEPIETYSTSEHLAADLGIPAKITGKLPEDQRTRAGLDAEEVEDLGETGGQRGRRRRTVVGGRSGKGRAGRPEASATETEDRPRRKRRPRLRTRGGQPVEPAAGTDVPEAVVEIENTPATGDDGDKPARRKRRRRRRSGGASPEA
ncbi:MAG: DEAD/DEAH box helicase [Mycobacteriales bacterium]